MVGVATIKVSTQSLSKVVAPIAFNYVKFIVVRQGTATILSEFGQQYIEVGDVVMLAPSVLCGSEPHDQIVTTTIYANTDYTLDQLYWQYSDVLSDKSDARHFAEKLYSDPAQILRIGPPRLQRIAPWLDEMVALSAGDENRRHFHRIHALFFAVMDVVAPFIRVSSVRLSSSQRARKRPPKAQSPHPIRHEAQTAAEQMQAELDRPWTLEDLAQNVHLSKSQFSRVFSDAFNTAPLAYLRMLRAEGLAGLLRDTDLPIEEAMRRVGWRSRGHAARVFRQHIGVTPVEYRRRNR